MNFFVYEIISILGKPISMGDYNIKSKVGPISLDSRETLKDSLYIALLGEKYDGHDFIREAYSSGAKAFIINKSNSNLFSLGCLCWVVDDTLKAYQKLGLLHRSKINIPLIAITGSVGKTTTKEIVSSALSSKGNIVSSYGNNNNDIGVPKTILRATSSDEAIVVEMAMRGIGEIERLSNCSKPDIAVITNIGTSHIGRLGSRNQIAIAKSEIVKALNPNGLLIIPSGCSILLDALYGNWKGRLVSVSIDDTNKFSESTLYKSSNRFISEEQLVGNFDKENNLLFFNDISFQLPLEGHHNALNFMFAIAIARELSVSLKYLSDLKVIMPHGSNKCFDLNGITIMDETYNASRESVLASLDLLKTKPGRHYAVLGQMLELGEYSVGYHCEIAEYAVKLGLDGIILLVNEPEATAMSNIINQLPFSQVVETVEEIVVALKKVIKRGDSILFKASRAYSLEKIIPKINNFEF